MSAAKQKLNLVHRALLHLHKGLLDSERVTYESVHGPIPSPGAFLQLVIHDEWFAWLRSMSEFIIEIDIATDAKEPVTMADDSDVPPSWKALNPKVAFPPVPPTEPATVPPMVPLTVLTQVGMSTSGAVKSVVRLPAPVKNARTAGSVVVDADCCTRTAS